VLAIGTREDVTDTVASVPDLSLYDWWSRAAGPTDTGSVSRKDDPIDVPNGRYELVISRDDVGSASDGKADAVYPGTTTLTLFGEHAAIQFPAGDIAPQELLWGKGRRLELRQIGPLGDDFSGQCPRYESWTWELRGRSLVLSDPSPEPNCNGVRNLFAIEPLERVD